MEPSEPAVDVLVVGAGITGIYQLYRAREAGFSVQLLEAGGGVGGTWYWNRYPGARFDSESYTYALPVLEGAVRRLGMAGALRRATGDRALPQPRGRPVRPPAPHALRRAGHRPRCGTRRRRTWMVTAGDGTRDPRPVPHRRDRCALGAVPPRRAGTRRFRGEQHHTGRWPAEPVDFAGKRVAVIGTSSSGVQVVPTILDDVESRHRVPAHRQLVHAAQQPADHPRGAGRAPSRLRGAARDAEHVAQRLRPPGERARRVRRLRRRSGGRCSRRCGTARAS